MNKREFIQWVYANYTIGSNPMARELFENVLAYAETLNEREQYDFLCEIIPEVPERVIAALCL